MLDCQRLKCVGEKCGKGRASACASSGAMGRRLVRVYACHAASDERKGRCNQRGRNAFAAGLIAWGADGRRSCGEACRHATRVPPLQRNVWVGLDNCLNGNAKGSYYVVSRGGSSRDDRGERRGCVAGVSQEFRDVGFVSWVRVVLLRITCGRCQDSQSLMLLYRPFCL